MDKQPYITPHQAAEQYGVPLATVYRWCQEKKVVLVAPVPENWPSKYCIHREDFVEKALDWAGIDR